MATYLIVDREVDPMMVLEVEAKHIQAAVESFGLEDGQSVEVYRVAGPARKVTVKSVTKQVVEIVTKGKKK